VTATSAVIGLAWREARAARRRLALLVGAIAVGTAALVAINAFTANLRRSVAGEARALLGADLSFASRARFTPRLDSLADSLACGGSTGCGNRATVTSFAAMAYVPARAGVRLVRVTAVQGGWPFYGQITTTPAGAWSTLQGARVALVDPALLTALGAAPGDTLALGRLRLPIAGTVDRVPGDIGIAAAFGPRVVIPGALLEETGLLQFGARAEYEIFLRLGPEQDPDAIAKQHRPALRPERVRIRTVQDEQQSLGNALERLGRFLGLVALVALLLGGLGVASAVHVFIRQRMETIAVLRCIGATTRQVFSVYLIQAAGIGLVGSVVGAALGLAVQLALPSVLGDFLPVQVEARAPWPVVALGVGLGLWTALAFAILPLLGVRQISPLATLRRPYDASVRLTRDRWFWIAAGGLGLSVIAMAVLEAGHALRGLAFAAGIGVTLVGLAAAALALVRGLRRWFPHRLPYVWRQGLANLYRPANQTVAVVLALGFGVFLLATLVLVQHNLLRDLRVGDGVARPNLVLFDIQADQAPGVDSLLRAGGHAPPAPIPIVPMRIQALDGVPVRPAAVDTTDRPNQPSGWAVRREYRSTYRDTLVGSERLVAGKWWRTGEQDPAGEPVSVSVEVEVAAELGVDVGDEITWDVQGVPVRSRVTSLREVEWARFEPNFFVIFRPGALEAAPQTYVTLVRVDSAAARGGLQRAMVERFPNVSTLDLSTVQRAVDDILRTVAAAIRFMAGFTLVAGLVVLLGAIATTRLQRMRETVLLKTLGATRRQVVRIVLAEYLALGLLATAAGLCLASGAGWALAHWLFDTRFALPGGALARLGAAVIGLTVVIGLWTSLEAFRRTPVEMLREE
jgi:putative ABC transport system permease protein